MANCAPAMPSAQALSAAVQLLVGNSVNPQKEVSLVPGVGGRGGVRNGGGRVPAKPGMKDSRARPELPGSCPATKCPWSSEGSLHPPRPAGFELSKKQNS